jgi:hypothetical protein
MTSPFALEDRLAAGHGNGRSRHVARLIRCEHHIDGREFFGLTRPFHRNPFAPNALFCPFVVSDPSEPLVYAGTGAGQAGPGIPPAIVDALSVDQTTGALTPVGQATIPSNEGVNVDFIAITH